MRYKGYRIQERPLFWDGDYFFIEYKETWFHWNTVCYEDDCLTPIAFTSVEDAKKFIDEKLKPRD